MFQVLIAMYTPAEGNLTIGDIESITGLCVKSLDGADQITRHSLARLVGHILASTQTERVQSTSDSAQNDGNNESSSSTHTAGEGAKTMLSPGDMLAQLSSQFNKPNLSRKSRVGIFDFYAALLTTLGSTFVENNYGLIVTHLISEIVSSPRNLGTRYDTLSIRTLVGILLRDLIGVRMLSEQGQIGAIRELSRSYLKRWPAMMPGQLAPSSSVLAIVLREVAGLLQQLGNAPPPVQVCFFSARCS
jgi:hypothetical protein